MKFLFFLVSAFLVANAQVELDGQCDPNVKVVENFDVKKYTGLWYELYRYEQKYEVGGDCATAYYSLNEDGSVVVDNKMVIARTRFNILGSAIKDPEAGTNGKLFVTFPTFNTTSPYWVLSTDYDNYSLVYTCKNAENNKKKVTSWILSRTPTLRPQAVVVMNDIIKTVPGLDWDLYKQTNQTETACCLKDRTATTVFSPEAFRAVIASAQAQAQAHVGIIAGRVPLQH